MADRSVLVRIRGDASDLVRAAAAGRAAISGLRKEIDTTNDRTAWMAQGFLALGPALAPLGAAAVPAIAGIAAQMTVAGLAAGSLGLAFNGVFDAAKALNDYQLEPTAEHLLKLQQTMEQIGPAGAEFVRFLDSVGPKFTELQMAAREGMFPGMEEGITHILDLLPQVEDIVRNVSEGLGELSADAGAGLSGEGFADFFNYLESDAKPILIDMGHTVGNFAEGLAAMMVAFDPTTTGFSSGLREMSESFAVWAHGLETSASFADFLDYVEQSGPKVLDLVGSMVDAFVQIVEAAAPVGDVMLPALEALFDVIGAIANTPFGTAFIGAAAAMSVYGRAVALASITTGGLGKALFGIDKGFGATLKGADGAVARMGAIRRTAGLAAGGIGLLALSMTDVDEKIGLSNTAMGAMAGAMIGGPWGAAIGGGIGLVKDFSDANAGLHAELERVNDTLGSGDMSQLIAERTRLMDQYATSTNRGGVGGIFTDLDRAATGADQKYRNAMAAIARETGQAASSGTEALGSLLTPLGMTEEAFAVAASSAEEFGNSVAKAFGILDRSDALIAARNALRTFRDMLRDAPKDMHKGTAAYDEVRGALNDVARSSLEAAQNLKGMNRVRFLDRQRDAFINAATDMGITRRAAEKLATQLGLLDKSDAKPKIDGDSKPLKGKLDQAGLWLAGYGKKHPSAKIDGDNKPAKGKVDEANKWLTVIGGRAVNPKINVSSNAAAIAAETNSALDRIQDEEVWITTRRRGTGLGAVGGADGMTVPGSRWPYGDKVFSHLAPGEEVISNRYGQADRHRDLLKAISANRYEDGGTVGRAQVAASRSHTRIERIVETRTIVLDAGELGQMVVDVADDRIGDYRQHDALNAGTKWAGVTSD